MVYPQDGFELLKLFGEIENAGYVNPVVLRDANAGFSVQRKYPSDKRASCPYYDSRLIFRSDF